VTVSSYALEVQWDGTSWIDETGYLKSCEWRRGRDYSSGQTGRIQTGYLRALLQNTNQRYSPFNTSSPIYGKILPSVKIRMRISSLNLLDNPSFEVGAFPGDQWGLYNNGPEGMSAVFDTATPFDGLRCMKCTWTSMNTSTKGVYHFAPIPMRQGVDYVVSWYAKVTTPVATGISLVFNLGPNSSSMLLNPNLTAAWQRYAYRLRWDANPVDPNIFFTITPGFAAPANDLFIDALQLELGSSVSAFSSSGPVVRWQGFLDDILPQPGSRDVASTAQLRASGPIRYVADRESNTGLQTTILAGVAVNTVLDDAGWPSGDRVIDTGQVLMTRWKADTAHEIDTARGDVKRALEHLQELEESEFGLVGESMDGKIVFEDSHHRALAPHTTSQATFSDASGAALPYELIEELDPWRMIFNRFVAEVLSFAVAGSAALWTLAGETPSISPGATRTFIALYPNPGASTAADHVDAWGTVSLLANTASDGSGTDLTGQITVVKTPTANTLKIDLTNTSAQVAFITQLQAFGTAASKNNPARVAIEDAPSIAKYGKRTFPLGGKFYPTTRRAQDFCEYGISRFKDPQPLLNLTFMANMSAAHQAQMLARDISDRITVRGDGTGASGAGLGINADLFIESEYHRYDLKEHYVTYRLSYGGSATLPGDGAYWTIGISQIGVSTRLIV
jgi:hypothetical protein